MTRGARKSAGAAGAAKEKMMPDPKFEKELRTAAAADPGLKVWPELGKTCSMHFSKPRCCYGQIFESTPGVKLPAGMDLRYNLWFYNGYGYKFSGSWYASYADFMNKIAGIKQYPMNAVKRTPISEIEPLDFAPDNIKVDGKWVRLNQCVHRCCVRGIIAINEDGKLSEETFSPEKTNVWYEMDCSNQMGATFNVLYDGQEKWMPVDRYKRRLTTSMGPKASVDLKDLSFADRNLFDIAVRAFVEDK